MKSKIIKAVIACVVAVAIGFGGYYGYNKVFAKKTTVATVQSYGVSVRNMDLSVTVQGTGAAYAGTSKDISANNNGTLEDLSVKVGDTVTSGQTLFVSQSDEITKSVTTAKNNLTKEKLTLSSDESAEKVDDNKVAMDKLSVSDAKSELSSAYEQESNMTVKSPIGGVVTAVNNNNGDNLQSGSAVLTVVDMNSIKVKVSVDELDITKIKTGQTATVKFDAISDKTYDGTVETIAQTGTSSNSVTTYDVVVAVKNPTGIKLGMNANVTIQVQNKQNALVIPAEALIEKGGKKYVKVQKTDSTTSSSQNQSNSGQTNSQLSTDSSDYTLVEIKTGLETQNYIEVTEGLTEGQKVLVQVTTSSSSSSSSNKNSNFGGMGGFGGDMGGGMPHGSSSGTGNSGGTNGAANSGTKN